MLVCKLITTGFACFMDSNIDRSILVSMIGLNIRLDNVWKNYFVEWEYVSRSDIDRFLIHGSSIYSDNWSIQSLLSYFFKLFRRISDCSKQKDIGHYKTNSQL